MSQPPPPSQQPQPPVPTQQVPRGWPPPQGASWPPPHAAPPPQQWQQHPPMVRPGHAVKARPPVHGWWTASGVLAFIGLGGAASFLGFVAVMGGFLLFLVGTMGGGEGIRQITDDLFSGASASLWIFVGFQVVSMVLGFLAGRACLRAKTSGAVLCMLLGVLGLGELIWCGVVLGASVGKLALFALFAIALIVCPALALRHPQNARF